MLQKKIFIFDDDNQILDICSLVLEDGGFATFVSDSVQDIVEKVVKIKPDVILMDNWIPDVGGVKATQQLKNHPLTKWIPVIYISANCEIQRIAAEAGADAYIAKPFDLCTFEEVVTAYASIENGPISPKEKQRWI